MEASYEMMQAIGNRQWAIGGEECPQITQIAQMKKKIDLLALKPNLRNLRNLRVNAVSLSLPHGRGSFWPFPFRTADPSGEALGIWP